MQLFEDKEKTLYHTATPSNKLLMPKPFEFERLKKEKERERGGERERERKAQKNFPSQRSKRK